MLWVALRTDKCPLFSLQLGSLYSGIVVYREMWPSEILRYEFSGTFCAECYAITVLWDVT
jgi:hypothetical protein